MNGPDTLRNALIRMKNGQGLRRVIRDDGPNGLHIANPNESVANTKFITRAEYDSEWELVKSGDQQNTEDISSTIYGSVRPPTVEVRMNKQEFTNQFTSEVNPMADEPRLNESFAARTEDTDREAMKEEILSKPLIDAQADGQPVAANEMPISTMEEDRTDEDAAAFNPAPEPEAPAEDTNAAGDEPVAANEDPTESEDAPKKRARRSSTK